MANASGITEAQLRSYSLAGEPLRSAPDSIRTLVGALRLCNLNRSVSAYLQAATSLLGEFDSAMTIGAVCIATPPTGTYTTAISGLTVTFTAADAGLNLSADHFLWHFGDGTDPGRGGVVEHTYKQSAGFRTDLEVAVSGAVWRSGKVVTVGENPLVIPQVGDGEPDPQMPDPYDPADHTVADVKDYINSLPDNGNNHPETQRVLDAERAGQNRTTLVDWLDAKTGAV